MGVLEGKMTTALNAEESATHRRGISRPLLGLSLGGLLGLVDGLSGYFYPALAPKMMTVITSSTCKGLVSGLVIGYLANKVHSVAVGIFVGVAVAAVLSYLFIRFFAGLELFWDIMLPGMLLGMIVGFATQRFGRK